MREVCLECGKEPGHCACGKGTVTGVEAASAPKSLSRPEPASLIGKRIRDQYEILSLIGQGGMGAVFKARHIKLDKIVALKIIRPDQASGGKALQRFEREAKAVSRLSHPNLAVCHDYGALEDGTPYVVMEFLDGVSLAALLQEHKDIEPLRCVEFFLQVASALGHAHKRGVLHRDLKPGNIMIVRGEGGAECVKVVDFGIAKLYEHDGEAQRLTETGEVFGSPVYMSPEQAQGLPVDTRADIYSLGCTMYEALSGEPPFLGANVVETIMQQVTAPAKPLEQAMKGRKTLPAGLAQVVMRCLEKEPEARYRSMDSLRADLEQVLSGSVPASSRARQIVGSRLSRSVGPHLRWIAAASVLLVFVVAIFNTFLDYKSWRKQVLLAASERDPDRAEQLFRSALNAVPPSGTRERDLGYIHWHIGQLMRSQKRFDEARDEYVKALDLAGSYKEQTGGGDRLSWMYLQADALDGLAQCAYALGHYERSGTYAARAVAAKQAICELLKQKPDHRLRLAQSLKLLAEARIAQGELDEASKRLGQCLEIERAYYKTDNAEIAGTLRLQGRIAAAGGDTARAAALFGQALSIREAVSGANHPVSRAIREELDRVKAGK